MGTPNYDLPIFTATDVPTWMGSWNDTMNKLDTAIKEASESGSSDPTLAKKVDDNALFPVPEGQTPTQLQSKVQELVDGGGGGDPELAKKVEDNGKFPVPEGVTETELQTEVKSISEDVAFIDTLPETGANPGIRVGSKTNALGWIELVMPTTNNPLVKPAIHLSNLMGLEKGWLTWYTDTDGNVYPCMVDENKSNVLPWLVSTPYTDKCATPKSYVDKMGVFPVPDGQAPTQLQSKVQELVDGGGGVRRTVYPLGNSSTNTPITISCGAIEVNGNVATIYLTRKDTYVQFLRASNQSIIAREFATCLGNPLNLTINQWSSSTISNLKYLFVGIIRNYPIYAICVNKDGQTQTHLIVMRSDVSEISTSIFNSILLDRNDTSAFNNTDGKFDDTYYMTIDPNSADMQIKEF